MKYESDQHLIKGLIESDIKSFNILFKDYYGLLFYIAKDILCDIEVAEELVQDTFVKLWEYRTRLAEVKSLKAYLTGMIRNRCFDYLKSYSNKLNARWVSLNDANVRLQLMCLASDLVIQEELYSDPAELILLKAIERLPTQCKQVFILNRIEGYTHRQIAEKLDISVSTVKTQIARALHKLKTVIPGIR